MPAIFERNYEHIKYSSCQLVSISVALNIQWIQQHFIEFSSHLPCFSQICFNHVHYFWKPCDALFRPTLPGKGHEATRLSSRAAAPPLSLPFCPPLPTQACDCLSRPSRLHQCYLKDLTLRLKRVIREIICGCKSQSTRPLSYQCLPLCCQKATAVFWLESSTCLRQFWVFLMAARCPLRHSSWLKGMDWLSNPVMSSLRTHKVLPLQKIMKILKIWEQDEQGRFSGRVHLFSIFMNVSDIFWMSHLDSVACSDSRHNEVFVLDLVDCL